MLLLNLATHHKCQHPHGGDTVVAGEVHMFRKGLCMQAVPQLTRIRLFRDNGVIKVPLQLDGVVFKPARSITELL